jgi:single-strand DNA-binding protein
MAGMVKLVAIGNLGSDPEMRATKTGASVCNFRVACTDARDKDKTEWIGAVCFGKTAELAVKFLRKGSQVCIDGRLQTREWVTKTGEKRLAVEVVVDSLVFLGARAGGAAGGGADDAPAAPVGSAPAAPVSEDEIPF